MPVLGQTPTRVHLNSTTPAPPAGQQNTIVQAGAPYPDPNDPNFQVTDSTQYVLPFVGDSGSGGLAGAVPAPAAGDAAAKKVLKAGGAWGPLAESDVTNLVTDLAAKAPLASPAFTGTPTAPTPTTGDDSTKIATTAFVEDTIDSLAAGDIPNIAESQVTGLVSDLAAKATQSGVQQGSYDYAADTGAANAYVVTLAPIPTLTAGLTVIFKAANANTTSSTLNVNSLGVKTIKKLDGATNLASGDIAAGQIVTVVYDGTNFQMESPTATGGGGSGNVTGPGSATDSDFAQFNGTTGTLIKDGGISLDTDGTLAANSDSRVASQKAGKTYADTKASKSGLQLGSYTYAADTGAANAYVVTLAPVPTLTAGLIVTFKAANTNTTASTLNVNSLGAVAIKKTDGATALVAGDITAGQIVTVVYDGTNFQVASGVAGAGGGAPTTSKYVLGAVDGALANSVYNPTAYYGADVAPASAGSLDDEFSAAFDAVRWTWFNQSTATATTSKSCLILSPPSNASSQILRGILQATPGTPWEVTAKFSVSLVNASTPSILNSAGLVLNENSTGKYIAYGFGGYPSSVAVNTWNSTTSVNAASATMPPLVLQIYLRVKNDGTNLIYSYSVDGISFVQHLSAGKAAFFTTGPDHVGISANNFNTTLSLVCDWFRRTL